MDLFQAEWCPHSHRVRQRLTELGLDFTARQVPAEPHDRTAMRGATGSDEIPVLVTDGGEVVSGEDAILDHLNEHYDERADAQTHSAKARIEVPTFAELRGEG